MSPQIGVNLRVTGNCSQGGRKYMEDMFCVAYQQTIDQMDLEYAFFGIFDGHGGHEAAKFAKEHLMKNIVTQECFWSDSDDDICQAIKDGFLATHYAMWRNMHKWPKTPSGLPSTSGTTASIVFIRKSTVYVGHVGDSGVILGQESEDGKWIASPLTQDHKPETPTELERIRAAGGDVTIKSGVHRVVWMRPRPSHQGPLTRSTQIDQIPFLAVARSLGDLWSYNSTSDQFVVSPEPDIRIHHIDLNHDRCIILGTDGLFNMLSGQDAVDIVEEAEKNNQTCLDRKGAIWLNPSKYLVDHAISKWMDARLRADNTSAVVLLLDPLGPPGKTAQSSYSPYTIESYRVKEGKCSSRTETSGMAICTWVPPPYHTKVKSGISATRSCATLRSMAEQFGDMSYPSTSSSSSSDDSVPQLLQKISLEDADESPRVRSKKTPRRLKKRKSSPHPLSRRESSLSDHDVAPVHQPMRTRRTRSEEPVRSEVCKRARCESDAENVDAPMRLRSTDPFKTLRSRNINLKSPGLFQFMDEPRTKRMKK